MIRSAIPIAEVKMAFSHFKLFYKQQQQHTNGIVHIVLAILVIKTIKRATTTSTSEVLIDFHIAI